MKLTAQATAQNEYTIEAIERMANALEISPVPARPMTKQEALSKLAPSLKAARDRGHTLQGLVEQLEAQGLRTHVRAVSAAIARLGAAKPARQKRATRAPSVTSPSTAGAKA